MPYTFDIRTNAASETVDAFLTGLRHTGSEFNGSNTQLAKLMYKALDLHVLDETIGEDERRDAETLSQAFEVIYEILEDEPGDGDYEDVEEDDDA